MMSIGKKLLKLRQSKNLSQEELGKQLHVSRQTISKWESDLSLPSMEMILEISSFYHISITELLDIDEKVEPDTVKQIYEQTSLVLVNLQKEQRRRRLFERIILIICGLCLIVTITILIKNNDPVVLNNSGYYECEHQYSSTKIDYSTSYFEIIAYNFETMTFDIDYKCVLLEYDNNTQVDFSLTKEGEDINYPMIKENDHTFILKQAVPLTNYEQTRILLKNGDNIEVIQSSVDTDYLSLLLEKLIYLYMPGDDNGKLIRDKLVYRPDYDYLINQNITYQGTISGTFELVIKQVNRTTNVLEDILEEEISLAQQSQIKLPIKYKNGDDLFYLIKVVINDQEIELANSSKKIQQILGVSYQEYSIYSYDNY